MALNRGEGISSRGELWEFGKLAFAVSMDMPRRMHAWYDTSQMRARSDEVSAKRYEPA